MDDLVVFVLRVVLRGLVAVVEWVPLPFADSIDQVWTLPLGLCIAITFSSLGAALYFGHTWLYRLFMGATVVTLGLVVIASIFSDPRGS